MNSDNFPPDSPDLSVVVPHFNQPQQLAHVLEDLLGQKSVRLEVLVVDDASEQPCDAVVAAFQGRGLCVSLLRQPERRYTLAARLRGMGEAHGRWLAFMDADDGICSPTAYAQAVKAADAAQTDILHFITLADKEGQRRSWNNAMPFHNSALRGEEIFRTWLAADCRAHSVWNKLYSRSLYQRLLSLDHHLPIFRIEDFYLTAHFLLLAQTYTPCDIAVYLYTPPAGTHLEKAAARAVDAMRMYLALPDRFTALGLPQAESRRLRTHLRKLTVLNSGRMCEFLPHTASKDGESVGIFEPEALQRIRRYGGARDFFLVLAIANASNARKLRDILHRLL
ncbi:glycosyltransferase [uncultured Desulfovibrio sp.]|uniref:glycosyltransferase family 2 protein n=1 Tax=uncultured Desulfovibrio sp. TaxID=167968 RepID=UPI002603DDA5|nr:glycosyltransferase [uncultured Desulfovibrio sp.]